MNYPTDFDNAEKRVQKIILVRSDYSDLAEKLFYVLENEPENNERQLQIIAELESMEKNPSVATKKFIKQAKSAAQFTYFRAQFNRIISEGSEQKKNKQYSQAIQTFFSGMYLYQDNFFEESYDETITNSVRNDLTELEKQTKLCAQTIDSLVERQALLLSALKEQNIPKSKTELQLFTKEFEQFAKIRNTIAQIGWKFIDTYQQLKTIDLDLTDASFLPFAYRLILGVEDNENSGITNSLDAQWDNLLPPLKPIIQNSISELLNNSIQEINTPYLFAFNNKFVASNEFQLLADQCITIANDINSLYSLKQLSKNEFDINHDPKYTTEIARAKQVLDFEQSLIKEITKLSNEKNKQANTKIPDGVVDINNNNLTYPNEIVKSTQEFQTIKQAILEITTSFANTRKNSEYWIASENSINVIKDKLIQQINTEIFNQWVNVAQYFDTGSVSILETYQTVYNQALDLLNPEKKPNEETGNVLCYPSESIPVIENQYISIDKDIEKLQTRRSRLTDSPKEISTNSENANNYFIHISNIESYIEKLNLLKDQSKQLVTQAKSQVILSQRAKNEADLRYKQAQENLTKNDFNAARENLQRAMSKYVESLSYQESDKLRANSDKNLEQLGSDINRQENEIIVKEVRKLKNDAKDAYYIGNFEKAETLLTQAQTRWAITNIDSDQEINNLLSLVNTALSMKTGRVIPPTAPLYPEMSQILSISKQYYDQGKKLIDSNNRTQALTILNEAKQKLRELQLVYPINQEASLLTLKIDKLIDENSFNEMFLQKYNAAKNDYLIPEKKQTAYIDLLDLFEINPKYPGLKDFIYKVEISLGIRIPPPDVKALNRSNQLTREVSVIMNSSNRDEISMNTALAKIDEAIRLNPDNDSAKLLKDRIQTSIGGKASVVLTAESEKLYQEAVQELQKGNTIQASALVSQLLQKKENKRSVKILDLKKKVDLLL